MKIRRIRLYNLFFPDTLALAHLARAAAAMAARPAALIFLPVFLPGLVVDVPLILAYR